MRNVNIDDIENFPNWRVGMSLAADWSWGFSIVVGMSKMYAEGFLPAIAWIVGNCLAIPLTAFIRRHVPSSKNWGNYIPMLLLFTFLAFLTININMKGLMVALTGGHEKFATYVFVSKETATWLIVAFASITIFYVKFGGLRFLMITDIGAYIGQITAIIAMAITAFVTNDGTMNNIVLSKGVDWKMIALFNFSGIIIGSLTHAHHHQKLSAIKEERMIPTGMWACAWFAIYMFFVMIVAFYFNDNLYLGIMFLILMISLAVSSIDSGVSGLNFISEKIGFSEKNSKIAGMFMAMCIIIGWPFYGKSGTLSAIWDLLAAVRTPVVLIFLTSSILMLFLKKLGIVSKSKSLQTLKMLPLE
ncbi:MAG: hypothetical protein WC819_04925 [Parcubacteria group bacterium]|jgi:hypothetical protein